MPASAEPAAKVTREVKTSDHSYTLPLELKIDGKTFTCEDVLGDGLFGVAYKAKAPDGSFVCLKQAFTKENQEADKFGKKHKFLPKAEKAHAELAIEAKLQKKLHEEAAKVPGGARVPAVVAYEGDAMAIELLEGAIEFQKWLREPPMKHDAADAASMSEKVKTVSWIVAKKVCKLLIATDELKFQHRDLQDNNCMIKILREPVTKCEDVEVFLIDFGKATCMVDGDRVCAFTPADQTVDNPTADTVRFIYSVQRSVLKSYEHAANGGAEGWKCPWAEGPWKVPDQELLQLLPFVELFGGFFEYLKDEARFPGRSAFAKASFLVKDKATKDLEKKKKEAKENNKDTAEIEEQLKAAKENSKAYEETLGGEMCKDLITFTRDLVMPQRDLLFPYYIVAEGDECKWYEPMRPKAIVDACPVP
eukprot:Transcript_8484.p1 GENE.Transcript_8484~~Transcript_8484.p1  ORF type:complete len:485 (-),score=194.37 Transcript_8484:121-1380(-)